MILRRKLFAAELALLLLFVGILFLGSFGLILHEVKDFEIERMRTLIVPSVYKRLVFLEEKNLTAKAADWAKWQDTARFVETGGKDRDYIEHNLTDVPFESLYVHAMLFFDANGHFLYGQGFDPDALQPLPVPSSLVHLDPALVKSVMQDNVDHQEGYWHDNDRLYLVSLRRIIDPKQPQVPKGVLLVARQFTPAYQKRLQEREIYPIAFRLQNHHRIDQTSVRWEGEAIVAYLPLTDVYGKAIAQVMVKVGGSIFAMLYRLFWLLSASIILAVLLLSLPSVWLWNRWFLRPFARLVQNIQTIGQQKDLKARLPAQNGDEFSIIAEAINAMLDGLERARQIEVQEARLKRILDNADTGMLTTVDDIITDCNPAMAQILGVDYTNALIGKPFSAFFNNPHEHQVILEHLREHGFIEKPLLVMKQPDGTLVYGRYRAFAIHQDDKLVIEGYFTDLTQAYIAQQKLDAAYRYYWEIFNQASEGIAVFDVHGKIYEVNAALLTLSGMSQEALLRHPFSWQDLLKATDQARICATLRKVAEEKTPQRLEVSMHRFDGQVVQLLVAYTPLTRQPEWVEERMLGIHVDISEIKRLQAELEHLSFHDTLTGLYNRAFFEKELKRLCRRRKGTLALVMVDVDDLKKVNDNLGHAAGDALIKGAAKVLSESFRPEDIVARVGGDEFVVLLTDIDETMLQSILTRLHTNIEKVQAAKKHPIFSLSIGAAWRKTPCNMGELIKEADQKMYANKAEHKKQAGRGVILQLPDMHRF